MGKRMCGRLLIITHQLINLQPYLGACPQSNGRMSSAHVVFAVSVVTSNLSMPMGNSFSKWVGKQGVVMERIHRTHQYETAGWIILLKGPRSGPG